MNLRKTICFQNRKYKMSDIDAPIYSLLFHKISGRYGHYCTNKLMKYNYFLYNYYNYLLILCCDKFCVENVFSIIIFNVFILFKATVSCCSIFLNSKLPRQMLIASAFPILRKGRHGPKPNGNNFPHLNVA